MHRSMRPVIEVSVFVSLLLFSSCNCPARSIKLHSQAETEDRGNDPSPEQPYYAPGKQAKGVYDARRVGIALQKEYLWLDSDDNIIAKGSEVVDEIIGWLEINERYEGPSPYLIQIAYEDFAPKSMLDYKTLTVSKALGRERIATSKWPRTRVVAAIDPVVVLELDIPSYETSGFGGVSRLPAENGGSVVFLGSGLDFGIRIPAEGILYWFSPDLQQKKEPVAISDNCIGRIPVPWGNLEVTLEDAWYVVRGVE